MDIEYEKKFLKDLIQVQDKAVKAEFENLLIILKEAKDLSQILNFKKLRSHAFAFRVRIGDLGLVFNIKILKLLLGELCIGKIFTDFSLFYTFNFVQ